VSSDILEYYLILPKLFDKN